MDNNQPQRVPRVKVRNLRGLPSAKLRKFFWTAEQRYNNVAYRCLVIRIPFTAILVIFTLGKVSK